MLLPVTHLVSIQKASKNIYRLQETLVSIGSDCSPMARFLQNVWFDADATYYLNVQPQASTTSIGLLNKKLRGFLSFLSKRDNFDALTYICTHWLQFRINLAKPINNHKNIINAPLKLSRVIRLQTTWFLIEVLHHLRNWVLKANQLPFGDIKSVWNSIWSHLLRTQDTEKEKADFRCGAH